MHETANTLVAEETAGPGHQLRIRRISGRTLAFILSVTAVCDGPEAACTSALRSLELDEPFLQPFALSDEEHYAALGRRWAIPVLLALALVGWLWRRSTASRARPR